MSQWDVGPWLAMIELYIKRIFVIILCWAMFYHGWFHIETIFETMQVWPSLMINYRGCHNVTFDQEIIFLTVWNDYWSLLTMVHFHIETIFITTWCWMMVDHSWSSYWDNLSHNTTLEHGWPSLTIDENGWFSYLINFSN